MAAHEETHLCSRITITCLPHRSVWAPAGLLLPTNYPEGCKCITLEMGAEVSLLNILLFSVQFCKKTQINVLEIGKGWIKVD